MSDEGEVAGPGPGLVSQRPRTHSQALRLKLQVQGKAAGALAFVPADLTVLHLFMMFM
jgi:hypothetical protein